MWPVRVDVQSPRLSVETPATLHWSQTTTNAHPQPSIHVNGRCCGTLQHRYAMKKTFQDKHHAYKFQVAITIVCHKAVDPSVFTQPPVTLTSEMTAVYAADAAPPLDDVNRQLLN